MDQSQIEGGASLMSSDLLSELIQQGKENREINQKLLGSLVEITSQIRTLTTAQSDNQTIEQLPLPPSEMVNNPLAVTQASQQDSNRTSEFGDLQKRKFDLIKNAPKYNGDAEQDIMIFLRGIEEYCSSNGVISDREQYDLLRWVLEGKAQQYVSSLEPRPTTYEDLKKALNNRFCKNEDERLSLYYHMKQRPGQTLFDYGDSLRRAAAGLSFTEKAVIHKFLQTISDSRLAASLALQKYQYLEECVADAEKQLRANKNIRAPVRGTEADKGRMSKIRCNHCNKLGHIKIHCPDLKKKPIKKKQVDQTEQETDSDLEEIEEVYTEEELRALEVAAAILEEDEEEDDKDCSMLEVNDNNYYVDASSKDRQKLYDKLKKTGEGTSKPILKIRKASKRDKADKMHVDKPPPPAAYIQEPASSSVNRAPAPLRQATEPLFHDQQRARPLFPSRSTGTGTPQANDGTKLPHKPLVPPVRPPLKEVKTGYIRKSMRLMDQPVAFPLATQIGLLSLASSQPMKFLDKCKDAAKKALRDWENGTVSIEMVEINETASNSLWEKKQTLYASVLLEGHPCYALIDTGAQISVITSGLVEYLDLVKPDNSNLQVGNTNVIGVNGQTSPTAVLTSKLIIGNDKDKRILSQRFNVIEGRGYKVLIGCDLMYFLQSSVDVYNRKITVRSREGGQLILPLTKRAEVMRSPEVQAYYSQIRKYIESLDERKSSKLEADCVSIDEVTEVGSLSRIAHAVPQEMQEYLGMELCTVLAGATEGCGISTPPPHCKVDIPPIENFGPRNNVEWTLEEAQVYCSQLGLNLKGHARPILRATRFQRIMTEHLEVFNPELGPTQKKELMQLLLDYADIVVFDMQELEGTADFPPFIVEVTSNPVRSKPYRLTRQDNLLVEKEIKELKQAGMVEDSSSPWLSPTFVVRPTTHRARMVTDYRRVNAITIKNAYPLPDILQLFDRLSGSCYFTTLDMKSGFYQIAVHPDSVPITAMGTDAGLYNFLVVPFGMCNAPSHFMNAINHVRQTEDIVQVCEAFVDDLTVHSRSFEDHLVGLSKTFNALRKRKFKIAAKKIYMGYTNIKLLGHIVGEGQVRVDSAKVQGIVDLRPPTTLKELRAFLGMVGYYRRFIENFARHSRALTELLKKDFSFSWSQACQQEFEWLKEQLRTKPVLALPTNTGKFRLYTDFCSFAVSAILHQENAGVESVIQYASKKCSPREAVLASAEGELLAVVFGLSKFRHYLAGQRFDLLTDSSAVTNLRSTRNLSAKLMRWSLLIADFDFELIHKSGKLHLNADGLSRANTAAPTQDDESPQLDYLSEDSSISIENIEVNMVAEVNQLGQLWTLQKLVCEKCAKLEQQRKKLLICESCSYMAHPQCVQEGRPSTHYWHCQKCRTRIISEGAQDESENEYLIHHIGSGKLSTLTAAERETADHLAWKNGLLYHVSKKGEMRIYPGPARRSAIVEEFHRRYSHLGGSRLGKLAGESFYWPGLKSQFQDFCRNCLPCQLTQATFHRRERLQGHLSAAQGPRQGWSIDLAPQLTTQDGKASILVAVDDFASFCKLAVISKSSADIAEWIKINILQEYGPPKYIRTDQGSEFLGATRNLCIASGITQIFCERAAPWRNGRAERMVRTIKRMIISVLNARDEDDWRNVLSRVQFAINSATSRSSNFTPFELFFGEKAPPLLRETDLLHKVSGANSLQVLDASKTEEIGRLLNERNQALRELALVRMRQYQDKMEHDYAAQPHKEGLRAKDGEILQPNTFAAIRNTQRSAWTTSGIGPFLVINGSGNTVRLQNISNGQIITEARENVLPLNFTVGTRARILDANKQQL